MRVLRWWSVISFWLLSLLGQFSWWTSYIQLELERVPNPARRPGLEEKLVVNKPNAQVTAKPASFVADTTGLEIMLYVYMFGLKESSKIFDSS